MDAQTIGLPRMPIVNGNDSRVVRAQDPLVGAHRDIHDAEIATLVLVAAGLLEAAPNGVRVSRTQPSIPA